MLQVYATTGQRNKSYLVEICVNDAKKIKKQPWKTTLDGERTPI